MYLYIRKTCIGSSLHVYMMQTTYIELAGIPIEVRSQYNSDFLRDFITDRPPLLKVEPGEADLDWMRKALQGSCSPSFVENNALHALLASALLDYNVLLMHGSALCMDGEAYIFTAPSGTGKSTHARLWRETFGDRVWMINDDKPLVKVEEERAVVYGSPWCGKHKLGCNGSARLKAVVELTRDSRNHIEAVKEPFPYLMQHIWRPEDRNRMQKVLDLEKRLIGQAAFYRMGCNTEPEAALVAWKGMHADMC